MKNFEDKFDVDEDGNGGDCDCECGGIPITCEECKTIAEYWYRQALEFAYKEIATYEDNGIIASDQVRATFINELWGELGEDEQETQTGESK